MNRRGSTLRTGSAIRIVAGREIRERLSAKSFWILTGLLVAIIVALGVITRFAGDDEPSVIDVGVEASQSSALDDALQGAAAALERTVEVTRFETAAAARSAAASGDVDVAVLAGEQEVIFDGGIDDETLAIVQQAWVGASLLDALAEVGLTPEQVASVTAQPPLDVVTLNDDDGISGLAILIGTASAVLLFISLQTFGGYVLTGVVEEKSTAVVEVLLVRLRADQLLAGKVIGIGVVALLQFALAVLAGLVSLLVSGADIPGDIWSAMPMTLVFFLGGYALYSTVFALAGSLVSRQEDAQAASAPIMSALIGAYVLVFIFGYVPDSTASSIMSMIPPIAPFLMPMRIAAGAASVVEVTISIGLLALATYGLWKLTGRIYEQVVLRRGSRILWREALTLGRRREPESTTRSG